jgi:hypothetical protein
MAQKVYWICRHAVNPEKGSPVSKIHKEGLLLLRSMGWAQVTLPTVATAQQQLAAEQQLAQALQRAVCMTFTNRSNRQEVGSLHISALCHVVQNP